MKKVEDEPSGRKHEDRAHDNGTEDRRPIALTLGRTASQPQQTPTTLHRTGWAERACLEA
jgi:hypothetical protein